jgi:3-dehydroquinate synthase
VAAGMVCASRLAQRRGLVGQDVTERQHRLLSNFGLPVKPKKWSADALLATMRSDKKSVAGQLRFILPTAIGSARIFSDVTEIDVRSVLGPGS